MIERGRIVRVVGRQVYVEVPRLGLGVQFGPCDVAWQSARTLGGGADAHTHALPAPAVGQQVLVAAVHGIPDDVVVLGIIG